MFRGAGVKDPGHPQTPSRKTTPSKPGRTITPKCTLEHYRFSPVTSPMLPCFMSRGAGIKDPGHPRTPPRKTTPSKPDRTITPKFTLERYGFSPVTSPMLSCFMFRGAGVKDPVHPQTPPRKATSPTPGGVTTPNSTFERHDSPSVASPKKALSTPETAPPLANKESAVESPVERVSGSTSNGAKPCGVDPGGSSRGATKDYLGESAGTPDSAARGHGHATSPEVKPVFDLS